ncbi:MAG TPA: GNAT family N-acetyltransferase [Microscillaceae bacterium]|nr:GNAT family N-acetyltransferase [Microscillaceae bacterium]
MKEEFDIRLEKPHHLDYIQIRKEVGFGEVSPEQSQQSLDNSLFFVCIYHSEKLMGFGRVVGDGVLFFYISDVMVSPQAKGQGIGSMIMNEIMAYLKKTANRWSTIALLAAPNKENFYTKFGFETCPNKYFGQGLSYLKLVELEV